MSKLERLLNLTAVLLATRRPLTAEELRADVEGYPENDASFRRAFERDKEDLRLLGIPLKVERVPATDPPLDGYRIDADEYYLPDPGLEPDELAALHLASLTVRLQGLGEQEALWKLGGIESPGVDDVTGVADIPADPSLIPVFSAISRRHQIKFDYGGQERVVDPWRLSFQRGRWYLSGHDHVRGGERNYRIDRIEGDVEPLDGTTWSTKPRLATKGRTFQAWEMGDGEATIVRLRVDAERVAIAARQLGDDVVASEEPEGSVVFDVPVLNQAAFRSFVLGFLDAAEILSPPSARDDLVSWLEELAAR